MLCRTASVLVCALFTANAVAAIEIRALTEVIEGHQVGGVTADAIGDLYVTDFGEIVWKISMEGKRHRLRRRGQSLHRKLPRQPHAEDRPARQRHCVRDG